MQSRGGSDGDVVRCDGLVCVGGLTLFANGSGSQPHAVDFARQYGFRQGDFQEVLVVNGHIA